MGRRQGKSTPYVRLDGDNPDTGRLGKRQVIGIGRLDGDDLVSGIKTGEEKEHERLRGAGSDDNLLRRIGHTASGIILRKPPAKRQEAVRRAVFQHFAVYASQAFQPALRSMYVRLADVQVIHLHSPLFRLVSQRREFSDGRIRYLIYS